MKQSRHLLVTVLLICSIFQACSPKPANSALEAGDGPTSAEQDISEIHVVPSSGSGRDGSFRIAVLPKSGSDKVALVGLLINDHRDGGNACYVFRNLTNDESMLVNDAGAGTISLAKAESVSNHQCDLLRGGPASEASSSGITVDFHVRFRPEFRGAKRLYVSALNAQNQGLELKASGEWTVK